MYVIVSNIYEPHGGAYKLATNPKKDEYFVTFKRSEREQFIEKWEYALNEDLVFDLPKTYFIDFENVQIIEITDKLNELKENK